jgi:hypothetical protein
MVAQPAAHPTHEGSLRRCALGECALYSRPSLKHSAYTGRAVPGMIPILCEGGRWSYWLYEVHSTLWSPDCNCVSVTPVAKGQTARHPIGDKPCGGNHIPVRKKGPQVPKAWICCRSQSTLRGALFLSLTLVVRGAGAQARL